MKILLNILQFLVLITFIFEFVSASERFQKSIDDSQDDNSDSVDDSKDESLDIAIENENNNITCSRRQNKILHEVRVATYGQFPFMAAIMSQQNEYLCAGTVVSNGIVLTTAQCLQQPIGYVLVNITTAKKEENSVLLHITKSEKFPSNTGSDSLRDVGIIYTEKNSSSVISKIKLSNYTAARSINDFTGLGFGLNADVDQPKELQYVGMEHRSITEGMDVIRGYFDCVDTKVPTCFKDFGGPIIFDNELVGIVTKGQTECTKEISSTYAINKQLVTALPTYTFKAWLDEKVEKNEEQEATPLSVYPSQPVLRTKPVMAEALSKGAHRLAFLPLLSFITISLYSIF